MKYTVEEAKNIFGISNEATKEDIEKKYDIELRKYNQQKSQGNVDEQSQKRFNDITDAYRILMGYEIDIPKVERKETSYDRLLKKRGLDRDKVSNFFYYHKTHIVIGVIALLVVAFSAYSIITKEEPDITIGLMGEINQDMFDTFEQKVSQNIPEAKDVAINSVFLSKTIKNEQDYANLQKAMIILKASDIDICIVNKYTYDLYVQNGPFMDLSEYAAKLGIDTTNSKDLKRRVVNEWEEITDPNAERKVKSYRDSEPKQYGLDISKSSFFKDLNIIGPEQILVVRIEPKNPDLDLKVIKLLTK